VFFPKVIISGERVVYKMIYDVQSPYFKRFLMKTGTKHSSKDVQAMLSQMLNQLNLVAAPPVNATSA